MFKRGQSLDAIDRDRVARFDGCRVGNHRSQRKGCLLERLFLGRAESAHADVGAMLVMLPAPCG